MHKIRTLKLKQLNEICEKGKFPCVLFIGEISTFYNALNALLQQRKLLNIF